MENKEIIDILIKRSRFVGFLSPSFQEGILKYLYEQGYFTDDLGIKFTEKGNSALHYYYYINKIKLLSVLLNLKSPTTVNQILRSLKLEGDWTHVKFLMESMHENDLISISQSTNWDELIKYSVKSDYIKILQTQGWKINNIEEQESDNRGVITLLSPHESILGEKEWKLEIDINELNKLRDLYLN